MDVEQADGASPALRVRADDPEYRRLAAAEAEFWATPRPFSLEDREDQPPEPGPSERHTNERYTGNPETPWQATIAGHGPFRRGLVLGTSSLADEAQVLETNPSLHVTFLDISAGALARRAERLGARFPGRVETRVADLNFVELEPARFDVVVSSGSVHHVTNLEHLAWQINRALTADGWFFLQDYVGECRFHFSAEKKRVFELLYTRDLARQQGREPGLVWNDDSDLSPFCGVRSDEVLPVLRRFLVEQRVRTAGNLLVPLTRSRPVDADRVFPLSRWLLLLDRLRRPWRLLRGYRQPERWPMPEGFWRELILVGDAAADAGLLLPSTAFAVYRKRG